MKIQGLARTLMPDTFFWLMMFVICMAFAFPQIGRPDGVLPISIMTKCGIISIFFIYGASLDSSALKDGVRNWRLHVITQSITFVIFPIVGVFLYFSAKFILTPPLDLGFFFLAALPSTVSSSVALIGIARGNVPAGVFNATLSGLIGIFITPLLIALVISAEVGSFPIQDSIIQIALILLAPFAAGQVFRPLLRSFIDRHRSFIRIFDRGVILLIIFSSFAASVNDGVWEQFSFYELIITGLIVVFALAFVSTAAVFISRFMQLSREDEVVVMFCGATKSLVNGVPIAQVVFAHLPGVGLLLLPILLFHQIQLIVFGIMARHYAKENDKTFDYPDKDFKRN